MRDERDRGERPKKSWREIDQQRDRSGGGRRSNDEPKKSHPAAIAAQKSYRAALERAFEAGTLGELARTLSRVDEPKVPTPPPPAPPPASESGEAAAAPAAPAVPPAPAPAPKDPERENRQKLLQRIKQAEGRDPITKAIDAFLDRYPKLPDDYEVLTKALSHKDDDRIREALAQLATLAAREKPRRGRTLVGQLRFLEETHGDPEIRKAAAGVRARL